MRTAAIDLAAAASAACSAAGTAPAEGRRSVELVAVNPASAQLALGSALELAALALDEQGNEIAGRQTFWASGDTVVASVSASGVVTARRVGAVQVQAAIEGKVAYSFITVVARPVASVTISPGAPRVAAGSNVQLQAVVKDDLGSTLTDRPLIWASGSESVARVTSSGLVLGVLAGAATITATADGRVGSTTVLVERSNRAPLADFEVTCAALTCSFTGRSTDADGSIKASRWAFGDGATSDEANPRHSYTAARSYTVELTVTDDGGATHTASKNVVVAAPVPSPAPPAPPATPAQPAAPVVTRVEVTPATVTLSEDDDDGAAPRTAVLTARLYQANGQEVTGRSCSWTGGGSLSGKVKQIVSIEQLSPTSARIRAREEGKTAVTATCSGRSGSAAITVQDD